MASNNRIEANAIRSAQPYEPNLLYKMSAVAVKVTLLAGDLGNRDTQRTEKLKKDHAKLSGDSANSIRRQGNIGAMSAGVALAGHIASVLTGNPLLGRVGDLAPVVGNFVSSREQARGTTAGHELNIKAGELTNARNQSHQSKIDGMEQAIRAAGQIFSSAARAG